MREIKFKAKGLKTDKWYVGYYVFQEPDEHYLVNPETGTAICYCCNANRFTGYVQINLETLGQFTGLHDKNGKEDWINDIAETYVGNIKYRRRIFQSEISGAYCINLPTLGSTSGEEAIMLCTCEHTNIGNIHETPELMEIEK